MNNSAEWQSYTTICRLCMQRDGFLLGIFNNIQGKDRSIYKKIMDCTALEVSPGDGLPNSICHRCLYKIEFCLEFRQQCFVSDATLRQINGLTKELQTTFQPPEENNVVMVVDPNTMDYESEYESEPPILAAIAPIPQTIEHHAHVSDVETNDTADSYEYKNVFMCKYCDRAFTDKTDCAKHETDDHDTEAPYRCAACDLKFADRIQYSGHLKNTHQNDKPYSCPECDRNFARRSDLRKHTIVHTGIKPYTCPICFKSFSRNTNLSKHIRIHKGQKPFVCPSCPRTFMSKLELTRHAVQHAGVKPFKCEYCHMSFMRKDKLIRHQKRHLPQENAKDNAQELQVMRENLMNEYGMNDFTTQDSNDNHIETNNVAKEDETKDEWPSTENMIINIDPFTNEPEHEHEHEGIIESLGIEPDISLNNSTESEQGIASSPEKHETNNIIDGATLSENEKSMQRFQCTMCKKKFTTADSLTSHMGLHSGDRPFVCSECGKAFMRKRELDRHNATHTGIKQFECTLCEKRFSRKDKLLRHTRIHDVNKEQCLVCGATFNRKDGLMHHMKTHVKEEPPSEAV